MFADVEYNELWGFTTNFCGSLWLTLWLTLSVYYKFVLTLTENTNVDEEIILFYMELCYNGATLLILWMCDFTQLIYTTYKYNLYIQPK